jgi:hypothetical protein
VNYAKRAKRVDVRRLKENIWKGLDIVVPHANPEVNDEDEDMVSPDTFFLDRPPLMNIRNRTMTMRMRQTLLKREHSARWSQV